MKRALIVAAVAFWPLSWAAQIPSPTTTTISVDWLPLQGGACGAGSFVQVDTTFRDTAGADWNDLTVRMPLQAGLRQIGVPDTLPTVSIAINGVPVGGPVTVSNRGFCWDNLQTYEFQTNALQGYRAFGTNTFSVYISGWNAGGPAAQLIFTTPPATFEFEYPQGQSGQQMLIHKYREDDTYPSKYQVATAASEKPRFRFPGVVKVNGVGAARSVWFRVIDPPDPAPYIPASDRRPNDNRHGKGTLMGPDCGNPLCGVTGGATLMARSNSAGQLEVTLEGTDRYAGDNYEVEASLDPNFTCASAGPNGTNICPRSAMVTAWKRIYLEKKAMFRQGAYIVRYANVGDSRVAVSDAGAFTAGQTVQLIHAPPRRNIVDQSTPIPSTPVDFFVTETNVVDHVEPVTSTDPPFLVLQHSIGSRFGPDPTFPGSTGLGPYLRDGIGVITGPFYNDFFVANPAYLFGAFSPAFVEYVDAPPSITAMPFEAGPVPDWALSQISSKWYESALRGSEMFVDDLPDHRQLIGASALLADDQAGGARLGRTLGTSYNPSFVFVGRIERAVTEVINGRIQNVHNLDPDRVNGEVTAHELVHQWNVNPNAATSGATEGHCMETDYGGTAFCLMHAPFFDVMHNAELGDGNVVLHYRTLNGVIDSEYVTIRTAVEPLPRH